MTYFITPGQNRYYINNEQRQLLIASELEVMTDNGWPHCDVHRRKSLLEELNNKELVEEICGNQWEGFVGQTTAFA